MSEALAALYLEGLSIPDISARLNVPLSTIRFRLLKLGVLRTHAEAAKLAGPKISARTRGKKRKPFSAEWKAAIKRARIKWAEKRKRIRFSSNGYLEYTGGQHKGRLVHDVLMERWIGRPMTSSEVVHHIDNFRVNNKASNLVLMSRSAHMSLHRRNRRK